jgi:hypothetical protein
VAAAVAVGALLATACGFPDVSFRSAGASDDASGNAEGGDDATGDVVPGDDVAGDDATGDVIATNDAPADVQDGSVFEASPDAPACDQDQDGYKKMGAGCNGNDCCDSDPLAHPTQTAFFVAQDHCGSWDYNCNGKKDYQYPQNLTCGGIPLTGCTGGSGFLSVEDCDQSGSYGTCKDNGAAQCTPGGVFTQTQACN